MWRDAALVSSAAFTRQVSKLFHARNAQILTLHSAVVFDDLASTGGCMLSMEVPELSIRGVSDRGANCTRFVGCSGSAPFSGLAVSGEELASNVKDLLSGAAGEAVARTRPGDSASDNPSSFLGGEGGVSRLGEVRR